mmetsp:Transcript_39796/g.100324  ORF Transcript_39796/g.100324 Transcript_39796/m.100324 type:complete len:658 (-) Transcript_39796:434-2407(-)
MTLESEETKVIRQQLQQQRGWSFLPKASRVIFGNSEEKWRMRVLQYCVERQVRWCPLVAELIVDERDYYTQVVEHGQQALMLYPYHLSDFLVKTLRITPFKYYLDIMHDVMKSEKSYDVIPNFTAADCVRLLGIGRNQYIDIMNSYRSRSWLSFPMGIGKKKSPKTLLPKEPVRIQIQYWWMACAGYITVEDKENSNPAERAAIETLVRSRSCLAGKLDAAAAQSLYRRGLIYFDVPLEDHAAVIVPPLEGFVMNRVVGDYMETLLYKVFVSIDERTTMHELASVLQEDVELVKQAVSLYCRLGFAIKKNTEHLLLPGDSGPPVHPSWLRDEAGRPLKSGDSTLLVGLSDGVESKRIGFIFDSTLTAFLMMGNLASGLKSHAVTMFEVGKLSDEALDAFLTELEKVESVSEGEAQRYFDHAITLKNTLRFLRHNPAVSVEGCSGRVDLLRRERLGSLDRETCLRLLEKNYGLLISMSPLTPDASTIPLCTPVHFGPTICEMNSAWFKLFVYYIVGAGPPCMLIPRGFRLCSLPEEYWEYQAVVMEVWEQEPTVISMSILLVTLNDALKRAPVFVHVYREEPAAVVDIPFPLSGSAPSSPTSATRGTALAHPPDADTAPPAPEELSLPLSAPPPRSCSPPAKSRPLPTCRCSSGCASG